MRRPPGPGVKGGTVPVSALSFSPSIWSWGGMAMPAGMLRGQCDGRARLYVCMCALYAHMRGGMICSWQSAQAESLAGQPACSLQAGAAGQLPRVYVASAFPPHAASPARDAVVLQPQHGQRRRQVPARGGWDRSLQPPPIHMAATAGAGGLRRLLKNIFFGSLKP